MSAHYNWCIAMAAIACFVAGVLLSHQVEPGVRVEAVTLDGDTPALHFLPASSGPHPVALLAHGITASKETLFRFGEALAAAGFVCFAVDLPGHGESARPFSTGEIVSKLEEVAGVVGPVDVFLGHSMGAGAGAWAVHDARLSPRLFIAVGANPDLGIHGPPLLLLAGRFEELFSPATLRARTDARLVLSSWSDHALEPYDPQLVNAAVEAACAVVGKTPCAAPTCWYWRLAGLVLGMVGAFGIALCLPELFPPLARVRGALLPVMCIVALALTTGAWFGGMPHLHRAHLYIVAAAIAWLVIAGTSRLGGSRWSLPALAAAVWIGCVILGANRPALFGSLFALLLLVGAVLGGIAARRGSQRDGDIAMALFVGYAIGQWIPKIL